MQFTLPNLSPPSLSSVRSSLLSAVHLTASLDLTETSKFLSILYHSFLQSPSRVSNSTVTPLAQSGLDYDPTYVLAKSFFSDRKYVACVRFLRTAILGVGTLPDAFVVQSPESHETPHVLDSVPEISRWQNRPSPMLCTRLTFLHWYGIWLCREKRLCEKIWTYHLRNMIDLESSDTDQELRDMRDVLSLLIHNTETAPPPPTASPVDRLERNRLIGLHRWLLSSVLYRMRLFNESVEQLLLAVRLFPCFWAAWDDLLRVYERHRTDVVFGFSVLLTGSTSPDDPAAQHTLRLGSWWNESNSECSIVHVVFLCLFLAGYSCQIVNDQDAADQLEEWRQQDLPGGGGGGDDDDDEMDVDEDETEGEVVNPAAAGGAGGGGVGVGGPRTVVVGTEDGFWKIVRFLRDIFDRTAYVRESVARFWHELDCDDKAVAEFGELMQAYPGRMQKMDLLGNILYVQGKRLELSRLSYHCFSIDRYSLETCCVCANYFSLRGDHAKAIEYFERALKVDPYYHVAWTLIGHEYLELKNFTAAVHCYRQAVEAMPTDYRAWYGLGHAYELMEMFQYAIYYFTRAARVRKGDSRIWFALGKCHYRLNRLENSYTCYMSALPESLDVPIDDEVMALYDYSFVQPMHDIISSCSAGKKFRVLAKLAEILARILLREAPKTPGGKPIKKKEKSILDDSDDDEEEEEREQEGEGGKGPLLHLPRDSNLMVRSLAYLVRYYRRFGSDERAIERWTQELARRRPLAYEHCSPYVKHLCDVVLGPESGDVEEFNW